MVNGYQSIFARIKWPRHDGDAALPSSADVRNDWGYNLRLPEVGWEKTYRIRKDIN